MNLSTDELTEALTRVCDATMPRNEIPRNGRRPTISELRVRRQSQRTYNDTEREERKLVNRAARTVIKKGNKLSKKTFLEEHCHNANVIPWGDAYKVAMVKMKGPSVPTEKCTEKKKAIIDGLVLQHEPTTWPPSPCRKEVDYESHESEWTRWDPKHGSENSDSGEPRYVHYNIAEMHQRR